MSTVKNEGLVSGQVRPDTVSDVFGLKVYSESGVYLGTVEDVRVDFGTNGATGLALTEVNPQLQEAAGNSKKGVVIPFGWVESVHDVVVTIDILERLDYS